MVKSQKDKNQLTDPNEKGGTTFDSAAWEGKSREELAQALCDMIESAPREIAVNWLQTCLLPMLEKNAKEGGMRQSA